MSIMDTLITNRTQADVIAGNAKGTYNASDLNRVGAAAEYLHDLFESYGYSMPNYKRIKFQRPGHYETQTVKKPILPDGYTQLEYIESTGTQYINTGYLLQSDQVSIRTAFSPTQTSNGQTFFGNQSSPNTILLYGSTSLTFYIGSTNGVGSFPVTAGTYYDFHITANSGGLTVVQNGAQTSLTYSGSLNKTVPMSIFANYRSASAINEYASMRLRSFQLWDNGVLVRDYAPAKRMSDVAVGLYDLVTNTFFENAGTGTFTAGPENIEYETITEEVLVPDERDPYTWFEDDIPTSGMMAQYITNLSELRGQLSQTESTPAVPSDMEGISWREANDIEKILEDVDALLTNIAAAWFYSGDLFSGEV